MARPSRPVHRRPNRELGFARSFVAPGQGVEPRFSAPKAAVLPLDDPGREECSVPGGRSSPGVPLPSPSDMGSLIKKRRKRMRKKKHKKMLKRTRFQRRAKK